MLLHDGSEESGEQSDNRMTAVVKVIRSLQAMKEQLTKTNLIEFLSEWFHRLFDLIRWGLVF